MVQVASHCIDFVKLGWSTSYVAAGLKEKLAIYRKAGLSVYFGGTLCEVFIARGAFDDYRKLLDTYEMTHVEVSDGSMDMTRKAKLGYIRTLATDRYVLSEVGSKDATKVLTAVQWTQQIKGELEAGSSIVITEARESGNVGVYRASGEVRSGLIERILQEVPAEKLLFEAPQKAQQVYFVKLLGTNVNLGNIATNEAVSLETLRLGLRGDTFSTFLGKDKDA
jgi:phosphosulfolactate synthase